ncbi:uncharacterized protein LOC120835954 [Ixodes scapularis]|uniref:uncharacterized protein LOC120835954 n=1 Tax=Ixodes scapularis TaxID=6945 RepID=UPI001A9F5DF9|nr:uncharacterized protein LOC120835954 [Ixodes scapularis]
MEKYLSSKRRRQFRLIKYAASSYMKEVDTRSQILETEVSLETACLRTEHVSYPPISDLNQAALRREPSEESFFTNVSVASEELDEPELAGTSPASLSEEYPSHDIISDLRTWAVSFNIEHAALDGLLGVLKRRISGLPSNSRNLLGTPKSTPSVPLSNGDYCHFGLEDGLRHALQMWPSITLDTRTLDVSFNVDGLPLFKSSSRQVWPVLGLLHHPQNKLLDRVFVVGLFCGASKPSSVDEYLHPFVQELECMLQSGLDSQGMHYSITVRAVLCDAPAKAFVKCTKGHGGYYGCDKCCASGVYYGRMTFPNLNAPLRTDDSFKAQLQEEHHKGTSPLATIGVSMVSRFPIDYMHCVCLGVVRKLIGLWLRGPLSVRLGSTSVSALSRELALLGKLSATDFQRKCRGLQEFDRWKATEFRFFLLYAGPVTIRKVVKPEVYKHFLLLHVGIAILVSPSMVHMLDYAEQLLRLFVRECSVIYGKTSLVYNVHLLIHLANDCRLLGPLDNFSCFPFENYLGRLKTLVRSGNKPLQQLHRRILEERACAVSHTLDTAASTQGEFCVVPSSCHMSGPTGALAICCDQQFTKALLKGSKLNVQGRDNCVLISEGRVVVLANILTHRDEVLLVGHEFKHVQDLYRYPCRSSLLSIFLVSCLDSRLLTFSSADILCKGMLFPFRGKQAFFPLLHLL